MIKLNIPQLSTIAREYYKLLEQVLPKEEDRLETLIEKYNLKGTLGEEFEKVYQKCKTEALKAYLYTPDEIINDSQGKQSKWESLEKELDKLNIVQKLTKNSSIQRKHIKVFLKDEFFDYTVIMDKKCPDDKDKTIRQWLIERLSIRVCPYCNHDYMLPRVLNKNQKMASSKNQWGAELDHYMPKAKYYFFGLSFYNLVPICHWCNTCKSEAKIDIHPYVEGFGEKIKFRDPCIVNTILGDKSEVCLKDMSGDTTRSLSTHIQVLRLDELYQQHSRLIQDLAYKAMSYDQGYYDSIIESFADLGLGRGDVYRLVFGTAYSESEMQNIPLSKFTKDILEQLGIRY